MRLRALILLVGVLVAVPAQAQSLFATRGLGLPIAPVDARAGGLGRIGVGLLGLSMSMVNPAEVAGTPRRGISAALQPVTGSATIDEADGDIAGTRFPMLRLVYPMGPRWVASLGYGGVLEQSWAVVSEGFERIGPDSVGTRDVVRSSGGISQLMAGLTYSVSPSLAVGLAAGAYTGNLDRRITRSFSDSTLRLNTFDSRLRWDYGGPVVAVGARWDPVPVARIGASFTATDKLDVESEEGLGTDEQSSLPYRFSVGASGWLSPELLLAVGTEYSFRGATAVFENSSTSALRRDTWRYGGGLEYESGRAGRRSYPIRLGASYAQLPYHDAAEDPAREWAGSFGVGFRLAGDEFGPLAMIDATFERGNRSGLESERNPAGLSENFWRFTFSLSLFGR
jgi:hypothetical protein